MDTLGRACVRGHGSFLPARRHFNRGHDFRRRCLMYHMSSTGNATQYAVREVNIQLGGLLSFNKSIVRTCNQNHRHRQVTVSSSRARAQGMTSASFLRGCPDLRWTHSHLFRETLELLRNRVWAEKPAKKKRPHQSAQDRGYGVAQNITDQRHSGR